MTCWLKNKGGLFLLEKVLAKNNFFVSYAVSSANNSLVPSGIFPDLIRPGRVSAHALESSSGMRMGKRHVEVNTGSSGAECLPALFPCWDVFLAGPWKEFYPLYSLAAQHAGLFKVGSSLLATWPKNVLWIWKTPKTLFYLVSLCAFRPYVCVAPLPVVRWCVGKALVIPDHCQARIS